MTELFGTLGPACQDLELLRHMFLAGMSGMRLNLSHAGLRESEAMIASFHEAAKRANIKNAELLIDLQGPELRIGVLETPLELTEDAIISLDTLSLNEAVLSELETGDELLLDDGKIAGTLETDGLRITRAGRLTSRKSVKIVGKNIPMPALTAIDRRNLSDAVRYGVSAVMQPFVRNAADLLAVREALKENNADHIRIFAKIENREGLVHLDEIIDASDMIVIARGDLGNDIPLSELPGVQKDIASACLCKKIPFLVVTQMLTSMIHSPIPTRAEVSDIFNAVTDGASAVMVTNETAVGEYPVQVMQVLHDTTLAAETWMQKQAR